MADLDRATLSSHQFIPKCAPTKRYIWLTENQTSVTPPAIIQTAESQNMFTKLRTSVNNTMFNNTVFTRIIQYL